MTGPAGADTLASLWDALREVNDPELPISLVDLGLIYRVGFEDGHAEVELTFTATGCPCMVFIKDDIEERLLREPNVDRVTIHEVWDPPWTSERVSRAGREKLRSFGVAL